MKISEIKTLTVTAITALLAVGIGGSVLAEVTLKYTEHDPPSHMRVGHNTKVWIPEIEKQTGGEVKIQPFLGGALFSSKESLKGVGDGVADIGFAAPPHYPRELMLHNIFALFPRGPGKYPDMVWAWRKVYNEVPAFQEELKKANVVPLWYGAGLPLAFVGKNPLKSLDDLKGDKWRAGGKWLLRYLGNAGALPVAVPWGDTYMALQTGTIDGVLTNYDGLHKMKFDEVANNLLITKAFWFAMPQFHLMNARKFNSLPKKLQDGILKASEIAEQKFEAVYDAAFEKVRSAQIEAGYTVTWLSQADVDTFEDRVGLTKLQAEWVKDAKKAGITNAAEIMAKVTAIIKEAAER